MQVPAQSRSVPAPHTPHNLIYDLRLAGPHSSGFYADIARFSDRFLAEAEFCAMGEISRYGDFVQVSLQETPRSFGEYAIEFLTVALLCKRYLSAAESSPAWALALAGELCRLRHNSPGIKPLADKFRAALTRAFLMSQIAREPASDSPPRNLSEPDSAQRMLDHLPRLIEWLLATGEFQQEAKRLDNWRSYLHSLPRTQATNCIDIAIGLFEWFHSEANRALGAYTRGVSGFLAKEFSDNRCREDQLLRGRQSVEYHLGMVAAEIMNRGLRADFESKGHKVLLIPACMRGPYAIFCRARNSVTDMQCAACSRGCPVNALTTHMRALGIQVHIVPHATGFSRSLERWQGEPDTGVAAVACLLNILPGGYEMRARGIAAQCVPLDFPGCQKHWRNDEIATTFNQDQLVQILAIPNQK